MEPGPAGHCPCLLDITPLADEFVPAVDVVLVAEPAESVEVVKASLNPWLSIDDDKEQCVLTPVKLFGLAESCLFERIIRGDWDRVRLVLESRDCVSSGWLTCSPRCSSELEDSTKSQIGAVVFLFSGDELSKELPRRRSVRFFILRDIC